MADLSSFETHVTHDRSYASGQQAVPGISGFVCPRADKYGGRDGIISPGVAAVNGLVPKGMKHVTNADIGARAVAASKDGRTDSERYKEYYAAGNSNTVKQEEQAEQKDAEGQATVHSAQQRNNSSVKTKSVRLDIDDTSLEPYLTDTLGVTDTLDTTDIQDIADTEDVADLSAYIPTSQDIRNLGELSDYVEDTGTTRDTESTDAYSMFSVKDTDDATDDTLDAFYEGLTGIGFGTDEVPRQRKQVKKTENPSGASVSPVLTDDTKVRGLLSALAASRNEVARVAAENDRIKKSLSSALRELKQVHDKAVKIKTSYDRVVKIASSVAKPQECVEVVLDRQPERLKAGGKGWEVNIHGTMSFGPDRTSCVLTIMDAATASSLISSMPNGNVVIMSSTARTTCAYQGHCVKIYADVNAAGYITCFYFRRITE